MVAMNTDSLSNFEYKLIETRDGKPKP